MNQQDRKKLAAMLNKQGHQLIALSQALDPDTPDEGEESFLEKICDLVDDIEDSPIGMIPQVKAAAVAVDAIEDVVDSFDDVAGYMKKLFR